MTANIAQKAVLKNYNEGEFSHLVDEQKSFIDQEVVSDPVVSSMLNQIDLDPKKCELSAALGTMIMLSEAVASKQN